MEKLQQWTSVHLSEDTFYDELKSKRFKQQQQQQLTQKKPSTGLTKSTDGEATAAAAALDEEVLSANKQCLSPSNATSNRHTTSSEFASCPSELFNQLKVRDNTIKPLLNLKKFFHRNATTKNTQNKKRQSIMRNIVVATSFDVALEQDMLSKLESIRVFIQTKVKSFD